MAPESAAPRRSDVTKAAILSAARVQFAACGYQGATIRAIASTAGVDPALVMRYFGNKEALFAEAANFDLRLPDLAALDRDAVGVALIEHFLNRWAGDETLLALMRASVNNDMAAERMRHIFSTQLIPVVAKLRGGSRQAAAARAGLVASQVLGLALCLYVLKLPPLVRLEPAVLARQAGEAVRAYLFDD
jgi:AcrR family transcriptional regulator